MRRKAVMLNVGLTSLAASFALLLVPVSRWLEGLLFGGKYSSSASLMPVLAIVPVVSSISMGYSMALRASGRPHFDLLSNIIAAPVSVLSAFFFVHWWGLTGAAISMILSVAVMSIVTIMSFHHSEWESV